MTRTKRDYFKSDIRKLREIATEQALVIIFLSQNKDLFFETDGRKRKSKKNQAARKFRDKNKVHQLSNAARTIYRSWKYLGIDCVKAGHLYFQILERKIEQLNSTNIDLKMTGEELNWDGILLETPKSKRFKKIDSFYYNLFSVKIDSVA